MLTFVGARPECAHRPLYQAHIEYLPPGVTAARHDFSTRRCVTTSLRSPPCQLRTATRWATPAECASLVRLHVATFRPGLAPACWKQTASAPVADDADGAGASSDGFCTRLPVVGSGGAGGGTTPPVASALIAAEAHRCLAFIASTIGWSALIVFRAVSSPSCIDTIEPAWMPG